MPSFKRSAFTLIELLVVISIIALLSAIIFPTFARARENARRASCSGNMKQIGLGLIQYTQDYDDFMPGSNGGTTATLQNVLQPYMKSYQVFQCPTNTQNTRTMKDDPSNKAHVSYAPNTRNIVGTTDNGGIFASNSDVINSAPVSSAAVQTPSSTIAMCEVNGLATTAGNPANSEFIITDTNYATMSKCKAQASDADDSAPCLSSPHLKTSNFLFADGHVKALQPEKTLLPVNLWNRNDNAAYSGTDDTNSKLIVAQSKAYSKG